MMETGEQLYPFVRQWAIDKVQEYNGQDIERIYDQIAIAWKNLMNGLILKKTWKL